MAPENNTVYAIPQKNSNINSFLTPSLSLPHKIVFHKAECMIQYENVDYTQVQVLYMTTGEELMFCVG